ncbi:hypothetical protein Poli38472_004318 [Pythium oligandrum]|uniref:Enoyl reductase (ER) domain-containing protein n=1 Tax=Pythium oligandrum TaxID=41045 RepID=A0A8K1FFR1_PYTOL|nr:hypothetical protein Poli38472_004318 [Pythium oligandrum]|eukprot:TMW59249.1 hypothetical protein Poli38472_004318 [Pythium oligandrum]
MTDAVPQTFRGYVYENFGDALQEVKLRSDLKQAPLAPTLVRVKVHSTAMNPADYKMVEFGAAMSPTQPTPETPFRLGFDVAGTVVEVGSAVEDVIPGDAVFGMSYVSFGPNGTFAEYVDVEATHLAPKPSNMTFNEAAGVPGVGLTSYQALTTHGNVKIGQSVLILGGTTGTGLFGIQIAKALGASFVAATVSSRNIEFMQGFGVDRLIDYTREKWWDVLEPHSIDLIYDCGVEPTAWVDGAQRVLKKDTGILVTIGHSEEPVPSPIGASFKRMRVASVKQDLISLTKLIEAGKLVTPIDSVIPFEKLHDALKKQKSNSARGKIVIEVISSA